MVSIKKVALLLVPAALTLAGCSDYDNGFDQKSIEYQESFIDAFGEIDPNQDWSMAGYYKAYVFGVEDGTLELLYSDPIAGKPVLIAQRTIQGGELQFNFNAVKGTKEVFARIKKANGSYTLNRYFEIDEEGVLAISPVMTRSAHGISEELSGTSRAIKGTAISLECPQLLDHTKMSKMEFYTGDAAGSVDYIDGYYRDKEHQQNVAGKSDFYYTGTFTNIFPLYNVIDPNDERPWWYVEEIAPFFEDIDGQEGCFKESENHVVLMKDGATPHLEKDLVFTVKNADASKSTGVFYLDYFFKGTEFHNQFGYFYYTGDAPTYSDFLTMPKFILVDNMSGSQRKVTTANKDTQVDWFLLGTQGNLSNSTVGNGISGLSLAESNWDTKVYGTRLYLTYFGENGTDATGTLDFPNGTKIGLFFIGQGENRENKFITSIAALNRELYNEVPHAASFKLNDKIVFAMEDMNYGGDKDINDAMFIAYGDFEKTYIPDIITPVEPEAQNWVMACEDLGGSFDYDFNDLVFALRMTPLSDGINSKLELVPLAAGGTMDARIEYNGTSYGEIHSIVSPSGPITSPINVTPGSSPSKGYPITLATSISSETNINDIAKQIRIVVTSGSSTTDNAENGTNKYNIGYHKNGDADKAPQVLLLPGGWDWPSESTFICDIYPNFSSWVKDGDVTSWCNTKKEGATKFANNPLPYVAPSSGSGSGSGSGTVTPPAADGNNGWNITIAGEQTMGMNTTQTLTVSVADLSDYSNVQFGTYSTNVFTASKVDNTHYTITTVNNALGTARFYVLVPGDATHATTRKTYEITVGAAVPEFYFVTNGNNKDRVTTGALTLDVSPTNANIDLGIEVVKGDGNAITWGSSDESIVKVVNNQLQRVACGTVTIYAKHAAVESANGNYQGLTKTISLTIAKLDPVFTLTPTSMQLGENESKAYTISETAGANDYTKWSADETIAIPTTVNGGTAIKGIKKGTTTFYVKHNETQWYKSKTQSISVTVSESQLDPWTMSISPEVPTTMLVGEEKEFTVTVTGEGWDRTGITYTTNSLLTATKNGFTVKLKAGQTPGTATFKITYPGDNSTHKTTSLDYTIEVKEPIKNTYDLTGVEELVNNGNGKYYTYTLPTEIDWSNVIKVELYFIDAAGNKQSPLFGSEYIWQLSSGAYNDITNSLEIVKKTTSFKIGNDYNIYSISDVKLRVTSRPSASAKRRIVKSKK